MSNTKIISNNNTFNHLDVITNCFKNADEVWMATAFLKLSGLELLLPQIKKHINSNKPIHIIAGQNFGLTEPKALRNVYSLFKNKVNANLYLDRAENKTTVFHPKLFAFKSGNKITIISGSANITSGGLISNEELSICTETTDTSSSWNSTMNFFNKIISIDNADVLSLMILNRYEQFYSEQADARKKQKSIPDKKAKEYSFDYLKLKNWLKEYRINNYLEEFKQREINYKKAKKLLNEIAESTSIPQKRFEEIIDALVGKKGQKGLWKSGSLLRLRFEVYNFKKEFRLLVKYIKDNQNLTSNQVFTNSKALVKDIDGARINYVTEIMMTYRPDRFANLNSNPIKVLKEEAGVYFKSHSSSYNGEDYEEYCEIIQEICNKLELKNMLEADSFFNEVYWILKEDEKYKG